MNEEYRLVVDGHSIPNDLVNHVQTKRVGWFAWWSKCRSYAQENGVSVEWLCDMVWFFQRRAWLRIQSWNYMSFPVKEEGRSRLCPDCRFLNGHAPDCSALDNAKGIDKKSAFPIQ